MTAHEEKNQAQIVLQAWYGKVRLIDYAKKFCETNVIF